MVLNIPAVNIPLTDFKEQFRNIGAGLGVEYSYNQTRNLKQSLEIGYNHLRYLQRDIYLTTQFKYAPTLIRRLGGEVMLGTGVNVSRDPFASYQSDGNGQWKESHPLSVSGLLNFGLGLVMRDLKVGSGLYSPFISYQAAALLPYGELPLLPLSTVRVGLKTTHFSK